jgi:hypothetical protein
MAALYSKLCMGRLRRILEKNEQKKEQEKILENEYGRER